MNKILTIIKILIFLVIFLTGGLLWYNISGTRTTIEPYPYTLPTTLPADAQHAENANVLIVGDRMAQTLTRFNSIITERISKNLTTPLRVYNWSSDKEGLHRTLHKLKTLKKWPPVIIYHGGSQEFIEKKFMIKDRGKILYNFNRYQDPKLLTAIMVAPFLSRILYVPTNYVALSDEIKGQDWLINGPEAQSLLEIGFKVFEFELEELIRLSFENNSNLIILTTPINFELSPQKVCDNSVSTTILKRQEEVQKLIDKGDFKEAYSEAYTLSQESVANAKTYYLLGTAAKLNGSFDKARQFLIMAQAFDCNPFKVHVANNALMKKMSQKHHVHLVDFDMLVARNFGRNLLFADDIYPQQLYYDLLLEDLTSLIARILKI